MAGLFDFAKGDKPSPFDFAPRKKKDRSFLYNLYDNIAGVDDGVNTPGERLGKGVNDLAKGLAADPAGMAGRAAQAVKGDMDNLMFEGGAMQRPQDVLGYAAAPMAPGAMSGRVANVLSSGGHKPSQDVLDLLKSGRGSEVTDEMMAAADPQFLYNNYDLPMDEASRMQRAGEMGFGGDMYHGSNASFDAFNPLATDSTGQKVMAYGDGTYLADAPRMAERYAGRRDGGVMYPVRENMANPWTSENSVSNLSPEDLKTYMNSESGPEALGYSGRRTDRGVSVVPDPANIRSRFARFDPRLKHLSNLSAAGAGAAYLGGQGSEQDQMAQIREYLARANQ